MKVIEKSLNLSAPTNLQDLSPDNCVFFLDIETTGLSADRSTIYLIGGCYPKDDHWQLIQWFAQTPDQEEEILRAAGQFIRTRSLLIHFNGNHFDLPFLHRRAERFGLADCFLTQPGLDLYPAMKPCRRLLNLPNHKLKTLEAFLGIFREDEYTGGELIQIYKEYATTPDPEKERLLLLHNEEDIWGMPELLPLLQYPRFLEGDFRVVELLHTEHGTDETLTLELALDLSVPQPVSFRLDSWHGILRNQVLHLVMEEPSCEMKYFFPDYRDYFYLPHEDHAIHASVAAFVEKEFKKKATAKTAYTRAADSFIPLPGDMDVKVFRPEYKGAPYGCSRELPMDDPAFWTEYLKLLVQKIR